MEGTSLFCEMEKPDTFHFARFLKFETWNSRHSILRGALKYTSELKQVIIWTQLDCKMNIYSWLYWGLKYMRHKHLRVNFFWGHFWFTLVRKTNSTTEQNSTNEIANRTWWKINVMQQSCVAKLFLPRHCAINDSCIPAATWGWSQNLGLQVSTFFWLFEWSHNNPITYINLNLMSALFLAVEGWMMIFIWAFSK
jgi:hypothetical protein